MEKTDKIVIICADEKIVRDWTKAIKDEVPHMVVEVYPNDTERKKTQFVLTFGPPENAFVNYPNLKVIASMAAGINHITNNHKIPNDVSVTKVNDPQHHDDMADFVLTLTLSYMRRLPIYFQQQDQRIWQSCPYLRPEDTTIGIMGIGAIGTTIGKVMLKNNFKVTGWSRSEKNIDQITTFHGEKQRKAFLETADVLVCILPLTKETEGILNTEVFNQLPKGAYLINVGRGPQLAEEELLMAIESGQLSGAALDVFQDEPLPEEHSFWKNKQITITPHTAGSVLPESAIKKILDNYNAMKSGDKLVDVVDLAKGY